jgi:hypothetical protein
VENQAPADAAKHETTNFDALVTIKELGEMGVVVDDRFVMGHSDRPEVAPVQGDAQTIATNNDIESETVRPPRPKLPSVTRLSTRFPAQDSFLLLQKWEGVVTRINPDTFVATLKDLTADGEAEEVEIPTEEIAPADEALLSLGAVFYWCIGYLDTLIGQRMKESEIRFRRLPRWSQRDLQNAQKEAEELSELLNWK